MNKFYKFSLLIVLAIVLFLAFGKPVFALEVTYPVIWGIDLNRKECQTIPFIAAYVFYLSIAIVGIVAVFQIAIAGFQYVLAGGFPAKAQEAKEKILNAVLGVVLLLSAWIILNTINPAFMTLVFDKPAPVGIWGTTLYVVDNPFDDTVCPALFIN